MKFFSRLRPLFSSKRKSVVTKSTPATTVTIPATVVWTTTTTNQAQLHILSSLISLELSTETTDKELIWESIADISVAEIYRIHQHHPNPRSTQFVQVAIKTWEEEIYGSAVRRLFEMVRAHHSTSSTSTTSSSSSSNSTRISRLTISIIDNGQEKNNNKNYNEKDKDREEEDEELERLFEKYKEILKQLVIYKLITKTIMK